jgi:hypothetical protein
VVTYGTSTKRKRNEKNQAKSELLALVTREIRSAKWAHNTLTLECERSIVRLPPSMYHRGLGGGNIFDA